MAWKEYAEEVSNELKSAQGTIARLRRELAEREDQLNGNLPKASQLDDLQHQLQEAIETKTVHARELAQAKELFQNTLAKLTKVEKASHAENQALQNQLAGKNEELRLLQAARAADRAPVGREKQLRNELASLEKENEALKLRSESLTKQLQAEKQDNLAYMQSDPAKQRQQDDDEILPRSVE